MYDVDIQSDIDEVIKEVGEFARTQVPFALAGAMNDTMFDVRKRIVNSTYEKAFTVRNKAYPGRLWRVDKIPLGGPKSPLPEFKAGAVTTMTVTLRQRQDQGDYFERHVDGGTKIPRGNTIAVPADGGGSMRTSQGRIAKRNKPRNIVKQKDTFMMRDKAGNKRFIAKRSGKTLDVLYVFAKTAKIKPTFRFYTDAFDTVDRVMLRHLGMRMARAIKTSRFT
jgi:hypothetical protein